MGKCLLMDVAVSQSTIEGLSEWDILDLSEQLKLSLQNVSIDSITNVFMPRS